MLGIGMIFVCNPTPFLDTDLQLNKYRFLAATDGQVVACLLPLHRLVSGQSTGNLAGVMDLLAMEFERSK
jgi:hypothetical protein